MFVAAACAALWAVAPSVQAQEGPASDPPTVDAAAAARIPVLMVVQGTVSGYAAGDGSTLSLFTASGTRTHWGTVAADWRLYPPGTRLLIEGFPNDVFTVEDSGGAVHGNVFDVWFPDLATAVAFGTRSLKVSVLAAPEN